MSILRQLLIILSIFPAVLLPLFSPSPTGPVYIPLVFKSCQPSFGLTPPDNYDLEQAMAAAINSERLAHSLPELKLDEYLTQAARYHSNDMADNDYFSHTGLNGSSPGDRMTAACYRWSAYGEIIGAGPSDVQAMLDLWLNSSGHRAIILDPGYHDFGVGYAYNPGSTYKNYWTVDFGTQP